MNLKDSQIIEAIKTKERFKFLSVKMLNKVWKTNELKGYNMENGSLRKSWCFQRERERGWRFNRWMIACLMFYGRSPSQQPPRGTGRTQPMNCSALTNLLLECCLCWVFTMEIYCCWKQCNRYVILFLTLIKYFNLSAYVPWHWLWFTPFYFSYTKELNIFYQYSGYNRPNG